ncbi:tautomerase family protein [Neoroseomonas soli]|uniref:Tautomerase family protein n=1 Tax=Neoroseomonas soli TaxID=1081025 RepID=A0A9X9WZG2_9PROT|nr:tautomerase family protein [Neoroseomonas soli]MBR0672541.1 tautomerase family protein [Neoroseomonas soli]
MPLVRIHIPQGWPEARIAAFGDAIHDALIETVDVPPEDRFQVIAEHAPHRLIMDPAYFGVDRGPGASVVHITFRRGRSDEKKRALYDAIARRAKAAGIRAQDVMVVLQENAAIDWSFGAGVAQMSPAEVVA